LLTFYFSKRYKVQKLGSLEVNNYLNEKDVTIHHGITLRFLLKNVFKHSNSFPVIVYDDELLQKD